MVKPYSYNKGLMMPQSELFRAIIDGKAEVVEALIRSGVNVNIKSVGGGTALHFVIGWGSSDPAVDMTIMKLLISNAADVNAKDDDGNTPLHDAAAWRSVEFVEFLATNGADARVRNVYGVAPFDLAWIRFEDDKTNENAAVLEYLTGIIDSQNP